MELKSVINRLLMILISFLLFSSTIVFAAPLILLWVITGNDLFKKYII